MNKKLQEILIYLEKMRVEIIIIKIREDIVRK